MLNRGDAAMRFLRTARELTALGDPIEVVACYTEPDRHAPFVDLADEAVLLGPPRCTGPDGRVVSTYCCHELVVKRLSEVGVDAVWPGWGFASEDPLLAEACAAAGLTFIGPPPAAMRRLGDKVDAKLLAASCDVPLAPWALLDLDGHEPGDALVARAVAPVIEQAGFPVMVKAANGGGGRGIRRVESADELLAAVEQVRREAGAAFGSGRLLVEACVTEARHVEVQFLVGADGIAETFGVRDCTVQRRHQKVLEETPSPVLSPIEEDQLTTATARMAQAAGYRGVGTAEFLFRPASRTASFCEVNARLQVEHTVTEVVWGIDLVRAQLDIARGRNHQRSAGPRGWAIEARLTAEDPERGFAPTPGRVVVHRPPGGPDVRVDAAVRTGTHVPREFDSLLAKVVGWGATRAEALATLARAVAGYDLLLAEGCTNRGAVLELLASPEVARATATTTWLDSRIAAGDAGTGELVEHDGLALLVAAVEVAAAERRVRREEFFAQCRTSMPRATDAAIRPVPVELSLRGHGVVAEVSSRGHDLWRVDIGPFSVPLTVEHVDEHTVVVDLPGVPRVRALVHVTATTIVVDLGGRVHRIQRAAAGSVCAPGPALLVALDVSEGSGVRAGQRIGTIEAMKTETALIADVDGVVEEIVAHPGAHLAAGDAIVRLRPARGDGDVGVERSHGDDGADGGGSVGSVWSRWHRTEEPLDSLEAFVVGREVAPGDVEALVEHLTRDDTIGVDEVARLRSCHERIAAIERLFDRDDLLVDAAGCRWSPAVAFAERCRRHALGVDAPIPKLDEHLRALASDQATGLGELLWRLAATRASAPERQRVIRALARRFDGIDTPDEGRTSAPAPEVVDVRTPLERRASDARRLGVVDPWEVIAVLEGRGDLGPSRHPALRAGRFVEYDLRGPNELVPCSRAPGEHPSGVIVGTIENPLPGRGWYRRVLIAGDPLRERGALGEAECRRIIAALDLAERLGAPVEWLAASGGARIAWSSGTENLDWAAAVLRRIVEFTAADGEIHVVVNGVNVGAQSYWNAEATMVMHTRGVLIMTPRSSMVLTGRRALEFAGSVAAADEIDLGGHDRVMGPNGQAQYRAHDLVEAYGILMTHHTLYAPGADGRPPRVATDDPADRDVCDHPYRPEPGPGAATERFTRVGELFDPVHNPDRKRPFAVRAVMDALVDRDAPRLERWRAMADADAAVVWDSHVGGVPVTLIGIESRPRQRVGAPADGPPEWAGGTLYPASSKKVARALRAASGRRDVVVLANLSGFDGSPESLRMLQLEYGAEIARAVVEFDGRIVFVVVGRYHGGAYVVFSKALNDQLVALALEGSFASVIGGAPAAAVVLTRDVRARAAALADGDPAARLQVARAQVAAEFDAVHSVARAVEVGSLDAVIPAHRLRPEVITALRGSEPRPWTGRQTPVKGLAR